MVCFKKTTEYIIYCIFQEMKAQSEKNTGIPLHPGRDVSYSQTEFSKENGTPGLIFRLSGCKLG